MTITVEEAFDRSLLSDIRNFKLVINHAATFDLHQACNARQHDRIAYRHSMFLGMNGENFTYVVPLKKIHGRQN
jgi:hypothetical protein